MIKTLGQVLDNLMSGDSAKEETERVDDTRLAAAALLVHASTIDGYVEEAETERLQDVLKERYGLSGDQLHELVVAAERSERDAVDIYSFTSKLKKALSEEDRLEIIEMMWEIAYADGEVHGYEENLIWRTAELLGISSRERIRARKKVEAQQ
ncbi:TerB family tellurite resistance protein [Dichotomicrobium thermohalophilum]|uniref:Putative tellurite resistance protein B-like protein n=1 Tax=Dichotomicrobium thermohalophilum TaxID=933063 RepID=A0A397PET5_9HYPH|nr:TerB family tellurite resistance protein [Dichotomicrobium thermohalophilum]RIA47512.1 putative tellurite resistance protein B-like protein [Dichotomicrobium thermohalophilum]